MKNNAVAIDKSSIYKAVYEGNQRHFRLVL